VTAKDISLSFITWIYLWFYLIYLLNFFDLEWAMVGVMVFNATFNNISVITWWSVLLVEETGVPGENY
jgi:prepilin signal peptidase PulO-like enzyme (type II secretory pathway)